MKIRIKGNSLRYRLSRTDVALLAESGLLRDRVDFGSVPFFYALQLVDSQQLSSVYQNDTITLFLPKCVLFEFVDTEKISYSGYHGDLHLLVEKDFTCLDNVAEDQTDCYPNPLAEKKQL